jgi:hypothetical protein
MISNRTRRWTCAAFLLGVLPACGGKESTDFSAESPMTTARMLASTQNSSLNASQLDINPPAYAVAAVPAKDGASDAAYVQSAQTFAAQNASRYGLVAGAPGLELLSIRRSLKGVHVTLQERVSGIPVAASTFTVSFDNESGNVYRVHSAVLPHQSVNASKSGIAEDAAYDIAWRHLGVSGELAAPPRATQTYVPDSPGSGRLLLVYRIYLELSAPFGAWQVDVDAGSGAVLAVKDTSLPRQKTGTAAATFGSPSGPLADRGAAFAKALTREMAKTDVSAVNKVSGSGLVFDPDPLTTLRDATLSDSSPASSFDNAYVTVALSEISQSNGVYKLEGPWAKIVDFEAPNTAPSTTANGNWTAKRGNNAFNDVMTYFHIDRNQRYIQSLGYAGTRGIQNAPIELDSDGLNGDDNSHYIPSTNRVAYGHGGVDDDEDADVILHEYNHAINYAINNSWSGGDTGAMGEGFGDYWAASNNVDTFPATFDNAKVFNWDANSVDNAWAGRRVDMTSLLYDPTQTYGAHYPIPGGTSDELWSTPLFQALLALRGAGVPKTQVDTILLEAQFGLGSNLTMRQMATAIVDTAKNLYPMGPHAGILSRKFVEQNILTTVDMGLLPALFAVVFAL